jgi:hypothetical protein
MRIWSISPKYLDSKRLGAQWREALLCRNVIKGLTTGYKNHPQFLRIMKHSNPIEFINAYLVTIWKEAKSRGYNYDISKIERVDMSLVKPIKVTCGQAWYEFIHLQNKIESSKDYDKYWANQKNAQSDGCELEVNLLFKKVPGEIEDFERPKNYETIKPERA